MSHAHPQATFTCAVCGCERSRSTAMHGQMLHRPVLEILRGRRTEWNGADLVCADCVRDARAEYVEQALQRERGELSSIEAEVVRSLRDHELLARDPSAQFERRLTFGEHVADRVASFGGSWTFILSFGAFLVLWMFVNVTWLAVRPFDPYPFILLNLVLSALAAIQAPVIMMSQNRQEAKDRLRSENDYRINLKAELEIRHLHSKMDQLLSRQWHRLLEIQQIQLDILQEIAGRRRGKT